MRHAKSRLVESRSACLLSAPIDRDLSTCRSPDSIGENPACPACPDVSGMYRGRVGTCSRPRYIGIYQLVGVPILSGRIPIYREMLDESAPVRLKTAPTPIISLQVPIYRDARRVGIYPDVSGIYRGDRNQGAKVSIYLEFTIKGKK